MTSPSSDPSRQRTVLLRHVVRRGIPVLVLLVAIAGAYLYWRSIDAAPRPQTAAGPGGPIPVHVELVQPRSVPLNLRFLGQTEGSQVVEIRSRVAGYLQQRTFTEGTRVEQGQKLFQIDPRPFEVELAQARARLASGQARLDRAREQVRRLEQLVQSQAATQEELDEWRKDERVAAAEVELEKAQIDSAELQLSYTAIEAPITGVIGRALKDVGSYVDAGANGLLAVVQQVDPIDVRFSVTEQETLRFRRLQAEHKLTAPEVNETRLEITLADGSTYPHHGRVNYVDVQLDQTTGTSVVRGQLPNPDGMLKPGQFIYAGVLGVERVDVIAVPQKAIQQSPAGANVMVVNEQNLVEARPIVLGDWSGTEHWIVERGLRPGDRVITDRLMMIRPGMPVAVLPPSTQPAAPQAGVDSAGTAPAPVAPATQPQTNAVAGPAVAAERK
jgi:membrane fusion protein (multidrug efflux system)